MGRAEVALKYGLHPELDLRAACADFYLLERLSQDTREPAEWDSTEYGTRVRTWKPIEQGSDSRLELQGMIASKRYEEFVSFLAREFSIYADMAIGGELRHATQMIHDGSDYDEDGSCPYWCSECNACHYEEQHSCYDEGCEERTGTCDHECGQRCCDAISGYNGCVPVALRGHRIEVDASSGSLIKPHKTLSHGDGSYCNQDRCEHDCDDHVTGMYHSYHECEGGPESHAPTWSGDDPIPKRLRKFFEMCAHLNGSRTGAWDAWMQFRKSHAESILDLVVEVFDNREWSSGYGGKKWGDCAKVLRDYRAGKLSDQSFVDRCWTLQHNGGSLFNKLYECGGLLDVLETQKHKPYDVLAAMASVDVRSLWGGISRLRRQRTVNPFAYKPPAPPEDEKPKPVEGKIDKDKLPAAIDEKWKKRNFIRGVEWLQTNGYTVAEFVRFYEENAGDNLYIQLVQKFSGGKPYISSAFQWLNFVGYYNTYKNEIERAMVPAAPARSLVLIGVASGWCSEKQKDGSLYMCTMRPGHGGQYHAATDVATPIEGGWLWGTDGKSVPIPAGTMVAHVGTYKRNKFVVEHELPVPSEWWQEQMSHYLS